MKDLVEHPSINLRKKGVNVSFINWEGEAKPCEEFQEVWVNIEGIPFKWLTWNVIAQVSSAIGVLVDVDWPVIFKSLYKKVRIKVSTRDREKIPSNKLFEFEQCYSHVKFDVEKSLDGDEGNDDNNDDDAGVEEDVDDDEELEDDFCRWVSCRKNTGYHAEDPKDSNARGYTRGEVKPLLPAFLYCSATPREAYKVLVTKL
jgi:hypothetical protein